MSSAASISDNGKSGFAAACARLVHPRIDDAGERTRQQRFIATVLAAPFVLAAAAALPVSILSGGASAIAAVCAVLCLGWVIALLAVLSGRSRLAETLALVSGAILLGSVVASAGGMHSPLIALFAALPLEAVLVARKRSAVRWGTAAGVLAAVIGLGGAVVIGTDTAGWAVACQWLLVFIYCATVWPRVGGVLLKAGEIAPEAAPAVEEMMEAAILQLDRNGEVLDATGRTHELFGLPGDLLVGKGLFERIHLGDRVPYLAALADMRRGAARRFLTLRLRIAAQKGTPDYAHFSVELIRRGEGGVAAIIRDDARAAALEAALAEQTDKTQQSELMRTRMLAAVSHELRTPLNAILGFSDALSREMFGTLQDERQREYVRLIHEAGQHLLSVVNALLDLSRIESGALDLKPEAFDIHEAVRLSSALVDEQARARNVLVCTQIGDEVGEVHCDRRAFQQILINLLSNAVKFTPSGGRVTIAAQRSAERLDLEVMDTGIGMSQEDLARVGTPFMQVESEYARQFEGTGLGLSLVKGLVGLQRGGMSVESAPGAGTRIRISLPIGDEALDIAKDLGGTSENGNGNGLIDGGFLKTA